MELYNLKDKGYKNYITGLSMANIPIRFYNQNINHVTVKKVFSIGDDIYKKMMLPFMLSKEFIFGDNQPDMNMLDILTDVSFEQYRDDLIVSISLILDIDIENIEVITIDGVHREILIKNKFGNLYLTGDKFNQLKSIVLFINNLRELKKSDTNDGKLNSTDEYNKRLEVFYKGKEEYDKFKSENSKNDFTNMFDFLVHSQSVIDYDGVLKMNLYQFYNSIKRYTQKEEFIFTRNLYASGQIPLKGVDIPNFLKRIMEDNR